MKPSAEERARQISDELCTQGADIDGLESAIAAALREFYESGECAGAEREREAQRKRDDVKRPAGCACDPNLPKGQRCGGAGSWEEKPAEVKLRLARAVIEALPKCDYCETTATHALGFGHTCDGHKDSSGDDPEPLPYRSALLAWKEAEHG